MEKSTTIVSEPETARPETKLQMEQPAQALEKPQKPQVLSDKRVQRVFTMLKKKQLRDDLYDNCFVGSNGERFMTIMLPIVIACMLFVGYALGNFGAFSPGVYPMALAVILFGVFGLFRSIAYNEVGAGYALTAVCVACLIIFALSIITIFIPVEIGLWFVPGIVILLGLLGWLIMALPLNADQHSAITLGAVVFTLVGLIITRFFIAFAWWTWFIPLALMVLCFFGVRVQMYKTRTSMVIYTIIFTLVVLTVLQVFVELPQKLWFISLFPIALGILDSITFSFLWVSHERDKMCKRYLMQIKEYVQKQKIAQAEEQGQNISFDWNKVRFENGKVLFETALGAKLSCQCSNSKAFLNVNTQTEAPLRYIKVEGDYYLCEGEFQRLNNICASVQPQNMPLSASGNDISLKVDKVFEKATAEAYAVNKTIQQSESPYLAFLLSVQVPELAVVATEEYDFQDTTMQPFDIPAYIFVLNYGEKFVVIYESTLTGQNGIGYDSIRCEVANIEAAKTCVYKLDQYLQSHKINKRETLYQWRTNGHLHLMQNIWHNEIEAYKNYCEKQGERYSSELERWKKEVVNGRQEVLWSEVGLYLHYNRRIFAFGYLTVTFPDGTKFCDDYNQTDVFLQALQKIGLDKILQLDCYCDIARTRPFITTSEPKILAYAYVAPYYIFTARLTASKMAELLELVDEKLDLGLHIECRTIDYPQNQMF